MDMDSVDQTLNFHRVWICSTLILGAEGTCLRYLPGKKKKGLSFCNFSEALVLISFLIESQYDIDTITQ